jgi:hypothetical protein
MARWVQDWIKTCGVIESMITCRILTILSLSAVLMIIHATEALGQQASRNTLATAAATNSDFWHDPFPPAIVLEGTSSPSGSPLFTELQSRSFSGIDGNSNPQTMNFSGTAQASSAFGILRVSAEGEVTNTYYNADNDPFYRPDTQVMNPNGVPDQLSMTAQATFEDYLQFGGFVSQLYVSYRFRITGTMSGEVLPPRLFFQIEGFPVEIWSAPFGHQGPFQDIWATQRYLVTSLTPKRIWVNALARFEVTTQNWPEGSNVAGIANLGNTITLEEIIVTDEDENIITGWTLESDSGTDYLALIHGIFQDRFESPPEFMVPSVASGSRIEQMQHTEGTLMIVEVE